MDESPTPVDRYQTVKSAFNAVLCAPESRRLDLIEKCCGGDSELEDEVRSMLETWAAEEQLNLSCHSRQFDADERLEHQRVGPYEIDRLLGRGGMGSVYLAHRADGQFDQNVAIKLIDLPIGSHLFRERLREERQILAGLQHPYIARLLNGGVAEDGCPYLAMEYVEGPPIQRYAAEHNLSEVQCIELFLRVCEAVQFAHQNFVVHRDLKPDNILVLADGTPRLLDFGTAKLVSPNTSDSELTRSGYLSYTPQYASPEQVLGKPITAASDTYSLGVLLYLLLTGSLPYQTDKLTTAEMQHVICEQAPGRPSLPSGKRLDGDLEAILLKALRKEPQERYATVEQFAKDLRDYLEGNPVAARRGTWRYRAGKFTLRHRLALASAGVLTATLAAGVIAVAWQARVANRERREAEARANDLRELSNSLLSELDDSIQQLPGSTNAQKILVTRVVDHLDHMAKDAQGDRQTQLDLIDAYTRLAALQGSYYDQNIGDSPGALESIGKAIAMDQVLTRSQPQDVAVLRALAKAQDIRGRILMDSASMQEAIAATQESINTYSQLLAQPGVSSEDLIASARTWAVFGDELGITSNNSMFDITAALHAYRQMKALADHALALNPNEALRIGFVESYHARIAGLEGFIDPDQKLDDAREGLREIAALSYEESQSVRFLRARMILKTMQIDALTQLGRYTEARTLADSVVSESSAGADADPQDQRAQTTLVAVLDLLAANYETAADPELETSTDAQRHDLAVAEPVLKREIAVTKRVLLQSPSQQDMRPTMADAQVRLGIVEYRLRKDPAAAGLVRLGLSDLKQICVRNPNSVVVLDMEAKDVLNAEPPSERDPKLALQYAQHAVELTHRKIPIMLLTLARAYRANGQIDLSRATAREGLALLPQPRPHEAPTNMRRLLEKQTR